MTRTVAPLAIIALMVLAIPAAALDYTGGSTQFAGGFAPANAPYGGFGGGACAATRTPVVFIHGNGDEARNWDYPSSTGVPSVYEAFRAAGYSDCELFGITWLSAAEQAAPQGNYHTATRAARIRDFVNAVKAYTGKSQVDVVAHSMGVTVALHGLDYGALWGSVRRFVGIAGSLRGLASCTWMGYANPLAPTCGSQNIWSSNTFGFYPHVWPASNPRMGDGGFRDRPSGKSTAFYTIRAGYQDEVLCSTTINYAGCADSAKFDAYSNVKAQLNVGAGSTAQQLDWNFLDWSIYNVWGGDADGVGHYKARNNTGAILVRMLTTTCTDTGCCTGYVGTCTN